MMDEIEGDQESQITFHCSLFNCKKFNQRGTKQPCHYYSEHHLYPDNP